MIKQNKTNWTIGIVILASAILISPLVLGALPPTYFKEPCIETGGKWNSQNYICTCPEGSNVWGNGYCYIKNPETTCLEMSGEIKHNPPMPGPQWAWFKCEKNGEDITSQAYENAIKNPEECLFKINEFCIKLWMLLVAVGGLLLVYRMSKK